MNQLKQEEKMKLTEPKYFKSKWGISLLLLPLSLIYCLKEYKSLDTQKRFFY